MSTVDSLFRRTTNPLGTLLSRWVVLAAALILLPGASSADDAVRFPQALYTFDDIARGMSTGGRHVSCASALRNRAALVRLEGRSWDEAVRLLSSALDISVLKQDDVSDSWTIVADAEVVRREDRWRRQLLMALREGLKSQIDARMQHSESYPDVYHRYEPLFDTLEKIKHEEGGGTLESPARHQAASAIRTNSQRILPEGWLAERLLRTALDAGLSDLVRHDMPLQLADLRLIGDAESLKAVWAVSSRDLDDPYRLDELLTMHPLPPDFAAYAGLSFDTAGFSLRADVALYGNGKLRYPNGLFSTIGPMTIDNLFRGYRDERTQYAGLGQQAAEWLDRELKETESFLQSDAAKERLEWPLARPPDCVSDLIGEWAAHGHHDVIMEIVPLRDGKMWAWWNRWRDLARGDRFSLGDIGSVRGAWSLRDVTGVLQVKDRAAFVDRPREYPMDGFQSLARAVDTRTRARLEQAEIPLEQLTEYAASAGPRYGGVWPGMYRGLPMAAIQGSVPLLTLIKRMTARGRSEMDRAFSEGREYALPLSAFQPRAIAELAASCRALAPRDPFFLRPDLIDIFRKCEIRLASVNRSPPKTLQVTIQPVADVPEWKSTDLFTDWPLARINMK